MTKPDSEFIEAFDWAVIRLASYAPVSASQSRLLFGTVSLLTRDRPRPVSGQGVESHRIGGGKRGTVYFRRTVLSAREAVAWYRAAGPDRIVTPVPAAPDEIKKKLDGIDLMPSSFEEDPPWPSLGVPLGTDLFSNAGGPGDPAPFRGSGAPRIHRRFGDNSGFAAVINDKSTVAFLKRRLHLDLSDYTEYLGGLALVVPDPVLRHVQHYLMPAEPPSEPERLSYRLVPRADQRLDNLQLTILERRSNLLSRFETVDVPSDGLVTIESSLPFHMTGYAVSHPVQGVIAYQQPLPFIRVVKGTLGVAGRKVRVEAPRSESPQSQTESYEITEFGHEIPFGVGEERKDALVRVIAAEQQRIRRAAAKQYKQTWFDSGQRDQALSFLRQQLTRARSSVIVADPYFGWLQIYQFLQAVPRTQIDFTILTSRLAFESEFADSITQADEGTDQVPAALTPTPEPDRLARFDHSLAELSRRGMKSVTALVLNGKTPPLHDRFLVIDDEVLFLGNSLNALGERASLILSVPDSEPILAKLKVMASTATAFESYASRRRATSTGAGGG
jgi:hypothetical protein